jgi:hypothetical protein
MSAMVAPPVASAGEPKKPVKKRKARSMPKLTEKTVGSWNNTKMTAFCQRLSKRQGIVKLTQRSDVHPKPTNLRNLTHRRPDNRSKTISGNVQGQTEGCWNLSDTKDLNNVHQTRCIDCRSNVDGECEEAYFERDEELLWSRPVSRILHATISLVL